MPTFEAHQATSRKPSFGGVWAFLEASPPPHPLSTNQHSWVQNGSLGNFCNNYLNQSRMASPMTQPKMKLYITEPPRSFTSMRIRGSAGLPPLEVDCIACSNTRLNKQSIVFVASDSRFERYLSLGFCLKPRAFKSNSSLVSQLTRPENLYVFWAPPNLLCCSGSGALRN